MTLKIWHSSVLDPLESIRNLKFLRQTPMTNKLVEQGHRAGAVVKKFHHRPGRTIL